MPVKSASANVPFYTNNSKMPNFELWHSCRKWAIYPVWMSGHIECIHRAVACLLKGLLPWGFDV